MIFIPKEILENLLIIKFSFSSKEVVIKYNELQDIIQNRCFIENL